MAQGAWRKVYLGNGITKNAWRMMLQSRSETNGKAISVISMMNEGFSENS
jgi:hypothetical protein